MSTSKRLTTNTAALREISRIYLCESDLYLWQKCLYAACSGSKMRMQFRVLFLAAYNA